MATSTRLDVNGNSANSGTTLVGDVSYHAVLFDADDGTYVQLDDGGGNLVVTFDDFTLPAGHMIKSVTITIRYSIVTVGGHEHFTVNLNDQDNPLYSILNLAPSPAGFTGGISLNKAVLGQPDGSAFGETQVDNMVVGMTTAPPASGTPSHVRIYALFATIVDLAPPTVTSILPSGSGQSPAAVSWTFNGDSGEPQTYYQVRVFREVDAAVGGFDPGVSTAAVWESGVVASGAHSAAAGGLGPALDPGDYRVYVRAAQIRQHWSPWAYSPYTVATGPNVPALTAPATGALVDANAGFRTSWTYSHPSGRAMGSWALRRATDGGAYQYWRESDDTWQAAIVWNTGANLFKDWPATVWPNAHSYAWSVAVRDTTNVASAFAIDSSLVATSPPAANVTAPTGTITTTTRPTVTWSFSDGAGRTQSAFQVKVFHTGAAGAPDGGTPVYDSGIVAGAATSLAVTSVDYPADSSSFTVYVRVFAGGQWSAWDTSGAFNVTITEPAAPLTVTAVAGAGNAVTITVTGQAEGGYSNLRTVIERQAADGTWSVLPGATALVPNGSHVATFVDTSAPPLGTVHYRAKIYGTLSGGGVVASFYTTANVTTAGGSSWWLKDVLDSSRDMAVSVDPSFTVTTPSGAGTFDTYTPDALVVSEEVPRAERFTARIWIKSTAQRDKLKTLLASPGRTLLLQDVLDQQWFVQVNGDIVWSFLRATSGTLPRENAYTVDVPLVVVAAPTA